MDMTRKGFLGGAATMFVVAFGLAFALSAQAKVELGSPFADGMVLQRGMKVPVWGRADPGETVKVSFAGQVRTATADAEGRWRVALDKLEASKTGRTLSVNEVEVKDVLVGEVWFASGQSNMEMPLVGDDPRFFDRQGRLTAQMTRRPLVRYAYACEHSWSAEPKPFATYRVEWKRMMPENLLTKPSFSAVAVYFALELDAALDVPIGIVGSYWGATGIDAWTPRCGYEGKDELAESASYPIHGPGDWKDEYKQGPIVEPREQPTVLWNEMVEPWCPMAMRGFIWYQGCHDALCKGGSDHYRAKMHALYDGWSAKFENPALKLYFVQLAPHSCSWYDVQLAQAQFAAEEPNAALVTTADVGNFDDIHPNDKGPVAKRLAALALAHDYGFRGLVADAPTLKACRWEKDRVVLSFNDADGWYMYNSDWSVDVPFELAGAGGQWKKAYLLNANGGAKVTKRWVTKGFVEGADLVVAADGVENPVKVRYLHESPWIGGLFAQTGVPLGPFEERKEETND